MRASPCSGRGGLRAAVVDPAAADPIPVMALDRGGVAHRTGRFGHVRRPGPDHHSAQFRAVSHGPPDRRFLIVCIRKSLNRPTEIADLFTGFNFFVHALVASLLIAIFVFAGTILFIIPGLVVAAMYKFTYLFIVDKRMEFWPAMQASHAVVRNDYFGFTMFVIAMALVNLLGVLCFLVGVMITLPVTIAAITAAYREIVGFDQQTVATL